MDDVEALEVDDDYYAFLNLSRDVSFAITLLLWLFFTFRNSSKYFVLRQHWSK